MRNDSHEDKVQIQKYLDHESYTRHLEWLIVNGERKRNQVKPKFNNILWCFKYEIFQIPMT